MKILIHYPYLNPMAVGAIFLCSSFSAFASNDLQQSCIQGTSLDHSLRAGIILHGEHWADLVLKQGGTSDPRPFQALKESAQGLLTAIQTGELLRWNEKIDGSPSVVFGFNAEGNPFIAYKGQFSRKNQALITSQNQIPDLFKKSEGLKKLFSTLFIETHMPLQDAKSDFENLIFQGDLLFVNGDERRKHLDNLVVIQPNAIPYRIPSTHALYPLASQAAIGIVLHTAGERMIDDTGRLSARPILDTEHEEDLIRKFSTHLRNSGLMALDPWQDNVKLPEFSTQIKDKIIQDSNLRLQGIEELLNKLSPDFQHAWSKKYEAKWRTYFNSGLRPPNDGGFYKASASHPDIDLEKWILGFSQWLHSREEGSLAASFHEFSLSHQEELASLLGAYALAIYTQHQLQPFLAPAMVSKLAGGEIEGVMLKTAHSIVKWIDRLDFTMRNNLLWNRASNPPQSRFPLDQWRPGDSFLIVKGQPIHAGHAKMSLEGYQKARPKNLFVLASNKAPDLTATTWQNLGAANTKSELINRNYVYIYDNDFRRQLLNHALEDKDISITFLQPHDFWSYVQKAKAEFKDGKVNLIVGQKEIDQERYRDQIAGLEDVLELVPIAPKQGGLSATQVRIAIKAAVLGTPSERKKARITLNQAFSYIRDVRPRRDTIYYAIKKWKELDQVAQKLIAPKPRIKTTKVVKDKKAPAAKSTTKKKSKNDGGNLADLSTGAL